MRTTRTIKPSPYGAWPVAPPPKKKPIDSPDNSSNPKPKWWKKWRQIKFWLPDELDGKYSIARMEAFDAYQKHTSLAWVIFVLLMAPVPLGSLVILINYIPLAKPEDGWKENGIVFFRAFLTCAVLVQSVQWERQYYLHGTTKTSRWDFFFINFVTSCFYVGILVLGSATIAFPLPFSLILPFVLIVPLVLIAYKSILQRQEQKRLQKGSFFDVVESAFCQQKYQNIVLFKFSLLFLYPIYLIGYRKVNSSTTNSTTVVQFFYTMVLPFMKFGLLILSKHHFAHVEDLAAVSSVFSVEFFNALFISMCMGMNRTSAKDTTSTTNTTTSTSTSWATSSVMMAIDCIQMVASLWILTKRAKTFLLHIHDTQERLNQEGQYVGRLQRRNIIEECLQFAREHQEAIQKNETDLRIHSSHGLKFQRSRKVSHAIAKGKEYINRAVVSIKHSTTRIEDEIDEIPSNMHKLFRTISLPGKLEPKPTSSKMTTATTSPLAAGEFPGTMINNDLTTTAKSPPFFRSSRSVPRQTRVSASAISLPLLFGSRATKVIMPTTTTTATTADATIPIICTKSQAIVPVHKKSSISKTLTKKVTSAQILSLVQNDEKYKTKIKILRETLGILYGLEHVILVEYVEAFIPFFYAVYLVATFGGSNREFFAEFRGRGENYSVFLVARNAILYGLLEWISLVVLVIYVKKRFHMNLLYHLSFVLETHFAGIQSIMAFFLVATLNFNLEHFGMDFEFSFKWLRQNSSN